jgi:transketolase
VGLRDIFAESGDPTELLEAYGLTAEHIAVAARQALGRRRG